MERRVARAFTLFVLCVVSTVAVAHAQPRFRLSQAVYDNNAVQAFFTLDATKPVEASLPANVLNARLDTSPLSTDSISAFDRTNEGVFYLVLVDVSKSLPGPTFGVLKESLVRFVGTLKPADRVAVYAFGERVTQVQGPTQDAEVLKAALNSLTANEGKTTLYLAISDALRAGAVRGPLPARRAILVVTDAEDDGSGLTADDLRRQLEESRLPIFAVGYRRAPGASQGLQVLQNLAVLSGGLYEESSAADVGRTHDRVQAAVRNVYVARFKCADCPTDGQAHGLNVTYTASGLSASDALKLPMPFVGKTGPDTAAVIPWWRPWLIPGAAVAGLIVLGGVVLLLRRRPTPPVEALDQRRDENVTPPPVTPKPPDTRTVVTPPPVKPPPPAVAAKLLCTIVHGAEPGRQFRVTVNGAKAASAGRDAGCDIRLERDPAIAGRHFELHYDGKLLYLVDRAGRGDTRINGVPIHGQTRVEDGDLVGAGSTEVRVSLERS